MSYNVVIVDRRQQERTTTLHSTHTLTLIHTCTLTHTYAHTHTHIFNRTLGISNAHYHFGLMHYRWTDGQRNRQMDRQTELLLELLVREMTNRN